MAPRSISRPLRHHPTTLGRQYHFLFQSLPPWQCEDSQLLPIINLLSLSLLHALSLGLPVHFFDMIMVDHYILANAAKDSALLRIHLGIALPLEHSTISS
jgi:hypothetical protein